MKKRKRRSLTASSAASRKGWRTRKEMKAQRAVANEGVRQRFLQRQFDKQHNIDREWSDKWGRASDRTIDRLPKVEFK